MFWVMPLKRVLRMPINKFVRELWTDKRREDGLITFLSED